MINGYEKKKVYNEKRYLQRYLVFCEGTSAI